jgi:hypothetical protein
MVLHRVVRVGFGRSLVRSGRCRFLGFACWRHSVYALLSPWGGPGCLWVLVGCSGRPVPGVSAAAVSAVRAFAGGSPLC